jgi:hypothetical protein
MHSKDFVQGPEFQAETTRHPFKEAIPKLLINSDEHREWQVYHAQS